MDAFGRVYPCYVSFGTIRLDPAAIGLHDGVVLIDRTSHTNSEEFDQRLGEFKQGVLFHYFAMPNGVTSIGDDAFSGCSGQTEIHIPESVTSIGVLLF